MPRNDNINNFFPGDIFVGKNLQTKNVQTNAINGTEIEEYITTNDIPNSTTLKSFKEYDGGLLWNGVPLVPPNEVIEDRPYTSDEMSELVRNLWDKYNVDDEIKDSIDTTPDGENGTIDTDWNK